jgi:hypothetical protein
MTVPFRFEGIFDSGGFALEMKASWPAAAWRYQQTNDCRLCQLRLSSWLRKMNGPVDGPLNGRPICYVELFTKAISTPDDRARLDNHLAYAIGLVGSVLAILD